MRPKEHYPNILTSLYSPFHPTKYTINIIHIFVEGKQVALLFRARTIIPELLLPSIPELLLPSFWDKISARKNCAKLVTYIAYLEKGT